MFEFKIVSDESEYLLFNEYHFLNSRNGKNLLMFYRLLVPVVSLLTVVILYVLDPDLQAALITGFVMTIFSIFGVVFAKKMLLTSIKNAIVKLKKDGKLPYNSQSTLRFNDESIHEITPESEHKIKYSKIEKVAVTENAVYVYFGSVQAFILPMNAFLNEIEKRDFLDFISEKINVSKVKN
jgi:hypothetical protein